MTERGSAERTPQQWMRQISVKSGPERRRYFSQCRSSTAELAEKHATRSIVAATSDFAA
jgi:hypothetical protein